MAYVLHAVIAPSETIRSVRLLGGWAIQLEQNMSILPMPDASDEMTRAYGQVSGTEFRCGHPQPPPSVLAVIYKLSIIGAVCYLEAEYFGGHGDQTATVWQNGICTLGPITEDHAFNKALRLIGVRCFDGKDEFDSLGLGKHRSDEEWLG